MKEVSGFALHRSCNFEASEYFAGNGCGKPRKWHRQRCSGRRYIHRSGLPLLFFFLLRTLAFVAMTGLQISVVFVKQQRLITAVLAPSQQHACQQSTFLLLHVNIRGQDMFFGSVWKSFIAYSHIPRGKVHTCIIASWYCSADLCHVGYLLPLHVIISI